MNSGMRTSPDPSLDRPREEFLDRNAITADEQLSSRPERGGEVGQSGMRVAGAPALDLDRAYHATGAHDEIDFAVAIAPVEQLAGGGLRANEWRARFTQDAE